MHAQCADRQAELELVSELPHTEVDVVHSDGQYSRCGHLCAAWHGWRRISGETDHDGFGLELHLQRLIVLATLRACSGPAAELGAGDASVTVRTQKRKHANEQMQHERNAAPWRLFV